MSYENIILYGATLPSYDYDKKKDSEEIINMDGKESERYLNAINY